MSAKSQMRDLTSEETMEAQARAYAAHWLTGRGAAEVLARMSDVLNDAIAAARRGEIERAVLLTSSARAGVGMVNETLIATGTRLIVSTASPIVSAREWPSQEAPNTP